MRKFLLVFLCFLSSCSRFDAKKGEVMLSSLDLTRSKERVTLGEGTVLGELSEQWWEMFHDPQLNSLMQLCLEGNQTLQVAKKRVSEATAVSEKVRAKLFPLIDLRFQNAYQHLSKEGLFRFPPSMIPAVINQMDFTLNLDWELDIWGRNRDLYRSALGEKRSAEVEQIATALILSISLAESYFSYQGNQAKLNLQRKIVEAWDSYAVLIQRRVQEGISDEIALEQAEIAFLREREKITELEENQTIFLSKIKVLLGINPDLPIEITDSFLSPTAVPVPEKLPLELISRRPDLIAKIWRIKAAAFDAKAAEKAFYPNLNLASFIGFETLSQTFLLSTKALSASLAPALQLPLYTGGKLTANLKEKEAIFEREIHDYNQSVLEAALEVVDGLKTVQMAEARDRLQVELVKSQSRSYKLEEARFTQGVANKLSLLETHIELLQERKSEVQIRTNRHIAGLQLIKALGGGFLSKDTVSYE